MWLSTELPRSHICPLPAPLGTDPALLKSVAKSEVRPALFVLVSTHGFKPRLFASSLEMQQGVKGSFLGTCERPLPVFFQTNALLSVSLLPKRRFHNISYCDFANYRRGRGGGVGRMAGVGGTAERGRCRPTTKVFTTKLGFFGFVLSFFFFF